MLFCKLCSPLSGSGSQGHCSAVGPAIVRWALILQRVHAYLKQWGSYVPFAFIALVLLIAISVHVRHIFGRPARAPEEEEPPADDGQNQ